MVGRWLGVIAATALVAVSLTRSLDDTAEGYYEQALTRALVTFALARTLNGVISVVQGTEVAVHPAGLGVTFAPGQLVDPLNDLIERFSWIMLVASTSLGIQKILMEISAWWGVQLLVAVPGALWIGLRLARRGRAWRALALRVFALALFLRLAMPLMVVLNHAVYDLFMAGDYVEATQVVEQTSQQLETLQSQAEASENPDAGWLDALGQWLDETSDAVDVRARLEAFEDRLSHATEHVLRLAAVFVLQTCILPLLFLWAFARALGPLVRTLGRPLVEGTGAGTTTPLKENK